MTRLAIRFVAFALLVTSLASCSDGTTGAGAATASRAVSSVHRDGRWMIDDRGRVILTHGVNAVWKLPPYSPPDEARGFTAADAEFLADSGLNGVRLGVLFAGVMPERGVIDQNYLQAIDRVVQLLAARGIRVLLDFHQDLYNEKFQGEGFPLWSVYDDGLPHPFNLGFPGNYFTPELTRTFDNLWANKNALWDDYRAAWRAVADKWRSQPNLLGYDLLNEPWPGIDWPTCANPLGCPVHDTEKLQPFQEHVLAGIREVDRDNVVWFEPNSIFNSGAKSGLATARPIVDANLGFSWHNYCLPAGVLHASGLTDIPGCELLHQIVFDNAAEAIARMGSTSLLTEFGASDDLADIEQVVRQADATLTGWLYWHYKEWADPTTESQTSGGQGMFRDDKDLSTLKQDKADILIRTYPQATAGTPLALSFDATTGAFSYRYTPSAAATGPTEIFVPKRHYPNGYDVTVSGAKVTSAPGSTLLNLENLPAANEVSVEIRAR